MPDVDAILRQALRARLLTMSPSCPPVAWEGYEYTPVVGTTYIRERLVPQDRRLSTLGPFGRLVHEGVWMVDIYTPGGAGLALADSYVEKVLTLFAPGVQLTRSGITVRFRRGLGGPAQVSAQWTMRPCILDWFTESTNTV